MKLRCAIIDDEPLALGLMERYVNQTPFLQLVSKYGSALDAIAALRNEAIDLLFLDIQMPDLTGLEFAKMVPAETRIIFTTAYSQYAVEGFKSNAIDYLLKPIGYDEFLEAAHRALKWFELARPTHETDSAEKTAVYVKSDYKLVKIELANILFVEGLKDYVKIIVEGQPKPILSLMSMKSLETYLPTSQFCRVHRSFIVRLDKIELIERGCIVFGKTRIPISDSNKEMVQQYINKHAL